MIEFDSGIPEFIAKLQNRIVKIHGQGVEFRHRLADIGEDTARREFAEAEYPGTNDAVVSQEDRGKETVVAATGTAVMFIEFGTGIRNAPYPGELPAGVGRHGTYGKGQGANEKGWIYRGEAGTGEVYPVASRNGRVREGIWRTFGNPPACCMMNAANDMHQMVPHIAKEVFSE